MTPHVGASSSKVRILFCGADAFWHQAGNRRHVFFLRGFAAAPAVERVYVVRRVSWVTWWRERRTADDDDRIKTLWVIRWFPERFRLAGITILNRALARWSIRRRLGSSSVPTVVWCYALSGIADADALNLRGEWFFDTDHDVVHDPNRRFSPIDDAESIVIRGARRSRRVFSASRNMTQWLRGFGIERLSRLRNGVNPERFVPHRPRNPGGEAAATPILGYMGVFSPWVDLSFLLNLARRRPEWRFVLAGPWRRIRPPRELVELDNVEIRGRVYSRDVPKTLGSFDIGLGLYRKESWLDVDSMKLHEYLAAELPSVTTRFHPHLEEDYEGLIAVAEDLEAFGNRIEAILRWTEDEWLEWRRRCREFVTRNTWDHRVREALAAIRVETGFDLGASGVVGSARCAE